MLITDGGGLAPSGAFAKPGELWTYSWSLYRTILSFRRVEGAVSPTPFMAKPWRRVRTTPLARLLSKRCPPLRSALTR